ncbi:recombinase family protein [Nordella sp. HKS 07]|uniref:recombinase family protein n=1 Tax=Nordella sp. HKS 07 TaxID=2712222 RepID=UPI0013E2080F|nr:recombinase family protein [Nordella sp. HKS 07]QIG47927.1 recombinase family protein [Nordella sp. HKS 07]
MRRAAIYLRVSTDKQTTENQERELRDVAAHSGWDIVATYRDEGISGAKSRSARPGFDALCKDATRRKFDVIMAWSVDRLGRSLQDLVAFLADIAVARVDLYLQQQGLDTTTPAGRALFQMCGVFAEFERAMIRERIRAGLARAKAKGVKLGRKPIEPSKERAIVRLLQTDGIRKVARKVGVGVGTVQRIARELRAPQKDSVPLSLRG